MVHLPALILPKEFITLLKEPNSAQKPSQIISVIRSNPALAMVLEKAFADLDDHQIGLEKISTTLGWDHFRDRMSSVYIYKMLHSFFPETTDMDLIEDIQAFEKRFSHITLAGNSRLFMLGFYFKTLNLHESGLSDEISPTQVSKSVDRILSLSKARTDRADWLVLMIWHLTEFLGESILSQFIQRGANWSEIYQALSEDQKFHLVSNLLSYGASIKEDDPFLYERI